MSLLSAVKFADEVGPAVDGAVYYYPFDEGFGRSLKYAGGYIVDTSLQWVQSDEYVGGYALDSRGNNGAAVLGNMGELGYRLSNGGDWAWAFTFKSTDGTNGRFFESYANWSSPWFIPCQNNGSDRLNARINDGWEINQTGTNYFDGQNHRVVVTGNGGDGSGVEMYVDGQSVSFSLTTGTPSFGSSYPDQHERGHLPQPFGCHGRYNESSRDSTSLPNPDNRLETLIDNVAVYFKKFTATDAQTDYQAQPWV